MVQLPLSSPTPPTPAPSAAQAQCVAIGSKGPCQNLVGCRWVGGTCKADPQGYPGGTFAPSPAPTVGVPPSLAHRCSATAADVLFIVDQSASISGPEDLVQRQWLKDFVGNFDLGSGVLQARFAILTFSARVLEKSGFDAPRATSEADFKQFITDLRPKQWSTNTAPALAAGALVFRNLPVGAPGRAAKKVAIILSDGQPNVPCEGKSNGAPAIDPITCAREQFAVLKQITDSVVFVRVGNAINSNLFKGKESLRVDADWAGMHDVLAQVLDFTCGPAVPSASPTAAPTSPTAAPTSPTAAPTSPTAAPTSPSVAPTSPSAAPTSPSVAPTSPSAIPSAAPSPSPSAAPTSPTDAPTASFD